MSSSENDSDIPEHVSLSASKRQVIGRNKDVAKELAQAKSKRKEHNRERDRRLKEQSLKQRATLISDSEAEEERSTDEDAAAKDPRLLPDHLFAAAFSQPSSAPHSSVPEDAPQETRQRKRKRADLGSRDRVIGSRTLRTLDKASDRAAARRTLPSSSVSKFSSRALNTKGTLSLSRVQGWQRKAANTGVMKTGNGPAAHFVRT